MTKLYNEEPLVFNKRHLNYKNVCQKCVSSYDQNVQSAISFVLENFKFANKWNFLKESRRLKKDNNVSSNTVDLFHFVDTSCSG